MFFGTSSDVCETVIIGGVFLFCFFFLSRLINEIVVNAQLSLKALVAFSSLCSLHQGLSVLT